MRRFSPVSAVLASCLLHSVPAARAQTAPATARQPQGGVLRAARTADQGVTAPATGVELLQRMRDAYRGRWFRTLTFTQTTTRRRADGSDTVSTWYESIRHDDARGTELRIDIGDPSAGNGVLYSPDSLWVLRGGHLAIVRPGGNALLPLIEGVYLQPVARTAAELRPTGIDLGRAVLTGTWNGRPAWIAGAGSPSDTTSPQIWVDVERKVVVRAILVPAPSAPLMDVRLDSLVPLSGGWLATQCTFYVAGKLAQREEYHDWAANVDLAPGLFEVTTWTTAPHWAGKLRGP
jgi:hypothetical protein